MCHGCTAWRTEIAISIGTEARTETLWKREIEGCYQGLVKENWCSCPLNLPFTIPSGDNNGVPWLTKGEAFFYLYVV